MQGKQEMERHSPRMCNRIVKSRGKSSIGLCAAIHRWIIGICSSRKKVSKNEIRFDSSLSTSVLSHLSC